MKTVLVIDGDEAILMLLEMILRRSNNTVIRARTGMEGLEIAHSQRPDIIFLDDRLAHMSSEEVCLRLRNDPHTQHIPIILTSTAMIQDGGDYARRVGADAFLPKPFQTKQVEAVLSGVLQT